MPAWKTKPSCDQVFQNDQIIQPETEGWFAERIGARKTIVPDAGYASTGSHNEEVTALILEAAEAIAEWYLLNRIMTGPESCYD